jgi:hypothetical protein
MDATVLVGMVVGSPDGCDDRVRLPHTALVSTLAGGSGEDETANTTTLKLLLENCLIISRSSTFLYSNFPSQGESR